MRGLGIRSFNPIEKCDHSLFLPDPVLYLLESTYAYFLHTTTTTYATHVATIRYQADATNKSCALFPKLRGLERRKYFSFNALPICPCTEIKQKKRTGALI